MATGEDGAGAVDTGTGLPEGVTELQGGTMRAVANRDDLPPVVDPNAPPRPEGLPEGFDNWETYAKSLEKPADGTPPEDKPADETPPAPTEAEQAAAKEALIQETLTQWPEEMRTKIEPFTRAFADTGTLTDAQVTDAAKAMNVPEFVVRQYMAGAEAISIKSTAAAAEALTALRAPFNAEFGGEEGYKAFQTWAVENLTDAQKVAYDKALDVAPEAALELARTYKLQMAASGKGPAPRDVTNNASAETGAGDVYTTLAEFHKDQRDPRYEKDTKFRDSVIAKLGRSEL